MAEEAPAPAGARFRVSGHGGNAPGQGPFLDVHLGIAEGRVVEARFETYLCPGAHDCGKALVGLVMGRPVEELGKIDRQAVAERVGPLPRARAIGYSLAAVALADALRQLERGPEVDASAPVSGSPRGE